MPLKIQSGMRFGEWEVIERDYHHFKMENYWG